MYRLIYRSRSKEKIGWKLIREILELSESSNKEKGISGALVATSTHFLQVIEGDFEAVNALFIKISRDSRHDSVQLLGFDCIDKRFFEGWSMHGIGVFDFNAAALDRLISRYGENDGELRFPTRSWKAMALINDLVTIQAETHKG